MERIVPRRVCRDLVVLAVELVAAKNLELFLYGEAIQQRSAVQDKTIILLLTSIVHRYIYERIEFWTLLINVMLLNFAISYLRESDA